MLRVKSLSLLATVLVALAALPLAAQTLTEQQFVASVNAAVTTFTSGLGNPTQPFIFSASLVAAYGDRVRNVPLPVILDYIDGLKAAGAQRISFNPGMTSMQDPNAVKMYDKIIRHIRELGLSLSIDPEYEPAIDPNVTEFTQYQTLAETNYPLLAARYQPDVFVLVHEPTTMTGRMNISGSISVTDWHNFLLATIPLVNSASPHTRIGAGCSYDTFSSQATADKENEFYQDWVTISGLDFMTMDIYTTYFDVFSQWAQLAQQNKKGVTIQATWAPHYLPPTRPAGTQGESLDDLSIVGPADGAFSQMDINWLQAMSMFASAYNMEAMTAYTDETFFMYGTPGADKPSQSTYWSAVQTAIQGGQLTPTAQAYQADRNKWGIAEAISINSASYPTLPTVFNPNCGPNTDPPNPCNPQTIAAADSLMSAFGVDLANTTVPVDGTFPTTLGGTTMTLVDSTNTAYPIQMFSVAPGQVNYYVPTNVQPGPATITVTSGDGTETTGFMLIAPVMPGLYTATSNGEGAPSALAICTGVCSGWPNPIGNSQFYQFVATCSGSSGCTPQPLQWATATDAVVLELFGTGVRHVSSTSALTAQIVNGPTLPVSFVGPQGDTGLDQVNVPLPNSLAGSGQIQLMLTAQDTVDNLTVDSNAVALDIH